MRLNIVAISAWYMVVYVSPPRANEKFGAVGREFKSRHGIGW
jgi:hypothetical protein